MSSFRRITLVRNNGSVSCEYDENDKTGNAALLYEAGGIYPALNMYSWDSMKEMPVFD